MGIEVKGPTVQQTLNKAPAGLGTLKTKELSAADALKNAEKAFDQTFVSAQAEGLAGLDGLPPVLADQLGSASVKEQLIGLFTNLKEQFLKAKTAGETAVAFESPTLAALAANMTAADIPAAQESALKQMSGQVPAEAKQAFDKLSDAFWMKKIDSAMFGAQLQGTAEAKFMTTTNAAKFGPLMQQVLEHVYGQANPKGKNGKNWGFSEKTPGQDLQLTNNAPGGGPDGSGGPGQTNSNQNTTNNDTTIVPLPDPFELEGKVKQLFASPGFPNLAGMDLDSLVAMVFFMLAKDAEVDLKAQLDDMQKSMKLKQVKREVLREMKQAKADMEKEARKQYDAAIATGDIDKSVTFDDYLAQCNVAYTPAVINETTMDAAYTAPVVTPPSPYPSGWIPQDKVDAAQGEIDSAQAQADCAKAQQQGDAKYSDDVAAINADPNLTDQEKAVKICEAANACAARHQPDLDTANSKLEDAKQDLAELQGNYGPPVPTGVNMAQFDVEIQKAQDGLDGMSEQTQLQQMQMQMYMDRRQKALEMLSNLLKKVSDTQAGIIKNMT